MSGNPHKLHQQILAYNKSKDICLTGFLHRIQMLRAYTYDNKWLNRALLVKNPVKLILK